MSLNKVFTAEMNSAALTVECVMNLVKRKCCTGEEDNPKNNIYDC